MAENDQSRQPSSTSSESEEYHEITESEIIQPAHDEVLSDPENIEIDMEQDSQEISDIITEIWTTGIDELLRLIDILNLEDDTNTSLTESSDNDDDSENSKYICTVELSAYSIPETNIEFVWDEYGNQWFLRINRNANVTVDSTQFSTVLCNYEACEHSFTCFLRTTDRTHVVEWENNELIGTYTYQHNRDENCGFVQVNNEILQNDINDVIESECNGMASNDMEKTEIFKDDNMSMNLGDELINLSDIQVDSLLSNLDSDFISQCGINHTAADKTGTNEVSENLFAVVPSDDQQKDVKVEQEAAIPSTSPEVRKETPISIYVFNLPLDITEEDLYELLGQFFLVPRYDDNKYVIEFYMDSNNQFIGSVRCTFTDCNLVYLTLQQLCDFQLSGYSISIEGPKFDNTPIKCKCAAVLKKRRETNDTDEQLENENCPFNYQSMALPHEPEQPENIVEENLLSSANITEQSNATENADENIHSECIQCDDVTNTVVHSNRPEAAAACAEISAEQLNEETKHDDTKITDADV